MNLTQMIQTAGDEISLAINNLKKRGIEIESFDVEIATGMFDVDGAAAFTRTVKITGLKTPAIISGALMQANSISVEVSWSSSCLIFTIWRLSNGSVKLIYGA
jgi:hypothetical protein